MTQLILIIGNKNYSSWSLRPWLALKHVGIDFTEVRIPLYTPTSHAEIVRYSPSGKVPALHHGRIIVWESLAICEYLAEHFPYFQWWPEDKIACGYARSISAEMHAGFSRLRQNMPMNCRARRPGKGMETGVQEDIQRITAIWCHCRKKFGAQGDMLFGDFTIADAMFAPVVSRFITYGVKLDPISRDYVDAVLALPAMQEWADAADEEIEFIPQFEL